MIASLTTLQQYIALLGFSGHSYDADLKSASLLNQAVQNLPPDMQGSCSLFAIEKHWLKATLFEFNDWLKERAEAKVLLNPNASKAKTENKNTSVTKIKQCSQNVNSFCIRYSRKGNKEASAHFCRNLL